MKKISFESDPHRQKHFEFFKSMDQPHFNITAPIEIGPLMNKIKANNWSFTPVMVWLIAKVANDIPAFRQRIRGEEIVEHELVHPSFTVLTKASTVFSFCYVDYNEELSVFREAAQNAIDAMQENPSFEDEHGRDDFLFLSTLPWIPFTSMQHAMPLKPTDSVPRITWGKYTSKNNNVSIPLSVQAHHALVDGIDMGRYFETFQKLCLEL